MAQPSAPAAFRVLSAGAVRRGLLDCLDGCAAKTGEQGAAVFDTAPAVLAAVRDGRADAEIVVAPRDGLQSLLADGRIAAAPLATLGEVFAGVVVRADAPLPGLATVDWLEAALAAADAVVLNRASSGRAVTAMLERLGLAPAVAAKRVEVENGVAVIRAVAGGAHGNAIGFAQSTEIRRVIGEGAAARFAGALSSGAEVLTRYEAGCVAGTDSAAAQRFVAFLAGGEARRLLDAAGVRRPAVMP